MLKNWAFVYRYSTLRPTTRSSAIFNKSKES